jgi:hypothetical protein
LVLSDELRASSQTAARFPVVWSTASRPKNCELVPASSLMRTSGLQVAPLSVERRNAMLVSLVVVLATRV